MFSSKMLSSFLLLLPFLLPQIHAHQSISFPAPTSLNFACRVGSNANCPGPCSRSKVRQDSTPNNPSISARRGSSVTLHTLANNHQGGFSRWSLVHVREMYNKQRHKANAFLYTCADINTQRCSRRFRKRDCKFDKQQLFYKHRIEIPRNVLDGVYVLGWVWYGGGSRFGKLGDYYDCVYIKVEGGPIAYVHRPQFRPGTTRSGSGGKCSATVNKVGICWREPCPGGARPTMLMKPFEFENRIPPFIPRSRYLNPYKLKSRESGSAFIVSITVRSADLPSRVYTTSSWTRTPYLYLSQRMRTTVTAEVVGNVRSVTFYLGGRKGRTDYSRPYSIAGDFKNSRTGRITYAPWKAFIDRSVIFLSVRAIGLNGVEHWRTMEISTDI